MNCRPILALALALAAGIGIPAGAAWATDDPTPSDTAIRAHSMEFMDPSIKPVVCRNGCINPIEAVTYASYLGERAGVAGEFELTIRAVGQEKGMIYLNSENDYRDRNCLTVAIPDNVAKQAFGTADKTDLTRKLVGKSAVFGGIARQVRIAFTQDGQATGKYYYQVHLRVKDRRQILRLPSLR